MHLVIFLNSVGYFCTDVGPQNPVVFDVCFLSVYIKSLSLHYFLTQNNQKSQVMTGYECKVTPVQVILMSIASV